MDRYIFKQFFYIVAELVDTFITSRNEITDTDIIERCRLRVKPVRNFFDHFIVIAECFPDCGSSSVKISENHSGRGQVNVVDDLFPPKLFKQFFWLPLRCAESHCLARTKHLTLISLFVGSGWLVSICVNNYSIIQHLEYSHTREI